MEAFFYVLLIIFGIWSSIWMIGFVLSFIYTFIVNTKKNYELKKIYKEIDSRLGIKTKIQKKDKGSQWYAEIYSELSALIDEKYIDYLENKKRPAPKKAAEARDIKKEKTFLNKKLKLLEYELNTLKSNLPIIEEIEEDLIDKNEILSHLEHQNQKKEFNEVRDNLIKNEKSKKKLSETQKNQLALDKYINKNHNKLSIGRLYERYIGYLYELENWKVTFFGIVEGLEDLGRDLICQNEKTIKIVQCKNWGKENIIREKHIYQLFATSIHYKITNKEKIKKNKLKVEPVFVYSNEVSEEANLAAKELKVELRKVSLDKTYPMIKCNINKVKGKTTKIYHLPFDQQYDKIYIEKQKGEFYALNVKEAEKNGFRRAKRFFGYTN